MRDEEDILVVLVTLVATVALGLHSNDSGTILTSNSRRRSWSSLGPGSASPSSGRYRARQCWYPVDRVAGSRIPDCTVPLTRDRAVRIDLWVHDDGGDRAGRDFLPASLPRAVDVSTAGTVARRHGCHRALGRNSPELAVDGAQLIVAEAPGPELQKLTPKIAETARILWLVSIATAAAGLQRSP